MFEETGVFDGCEMPLAFGAARLEAVALPRVTLVAPFKGRMMAVADVLKSTIGLILPPAGQCGSSAEARAYWRSPGQWLVFGDRPLEDDLRGMAQVADLSDAFGRCRLSGADAARVLARLVAVDAESMAEGGVAHTALADLPVTLIAVKDGYEIMLPRSYARSAVARLGVAMRSVAALALVE